MAQDDGWLECDGAFLEVVRKLARDQASEALASLAHCRVRLFVDSENRRRLEMAGSREFVRMMGDAGDANATKIAEALKEAMGIERSNVRVVYLPSALRVSAPDWPKLVKEEG